MGIGGVMHELGWLGRRNREGEGPHEGVLTYHSSTVGETLDEDHPHAFPLDLATHLRNDVVRAVGVRWGLVSSLRLTHMSDLQKKKLSYADDEQEDVEAEHGFDGGFDEGISLSRSDRTLSTVTNAPEIRDEDHRRTSCTAWRDPQ